MWRIVSRGRKPSATAWRVTENAPEITACEAITVATVASTTIGIRLQSGNSEEERVLDRGRVVDDQRALAQVVERQRREDERGTTRGGSAARPKWPMSAYSASAPVTASTTEPSAMNAVPPWSAKNSTA